MKKTYIGKSIIDGKGIFAGEPINRGEKIKYVTGKLTYWKSSSNGDALAIPNWYGVSRYTWIDPGETEFRYLNHSCRPSAAIIGTKTVIALRNLREGDEITIDYSMTDPDVYWSMRCSCKERGCRKLIRSIQFLPLAAFQRHMPFIPKYFQRLYHRSQRLARIRATAGALR